MESLLDVQDSIYGKNLGPPMLPHGDDPRAVRASRKRRRLKRTRVLLPPPSSLPLTDLPASSLPAGFPRELSYRALAAYSLIRTLSIPLRLSPFTPTVFLRALYFSFPNRLMGQIHVAILRILLKNLQMGYHWGNKQQQSGSALVTTKKRKVDGIRWLLRAGDNLQLLDTFTWPVFYDDYCHLTADAHFASLHDATNFYLELPKGMHPASNRLPTSDERERHANDAKRPSGPSVIYLDNGSSEFEAVGDSDDDEEFSIDEGADLDDDDEEDMGDDDHRARKRRRDNPMQTQSHDSISGNDSFLQAYPLQPSTYHACRHVYGTPVAMKAASNTPSALTSDSPPNRSLLMPNQSLIALAGANSKVEHRQVASYTELSCKDNTLQSRSNEWRPGDNRYEQVTEMNDRKSESIAEMEDPSSISDRGLSDESSSWEHFEPLRRMRRGLPYHRLDVKEKVVMLEFLLDELLVLESIASELEARQLKTSQFDFMYGQTPTQEELNNLVNEDVCAICKEEGELLCCDGCTSSYHRGCIDMPELQSLGEGAWICPECRIVDPATFGPLGLGQKSAVDWFKATDLAMSPSQACGSDFAGVIKDDEPEFLIVHGFVFTRDRATRQLDINGREQQVAPTLADPAYLTEVLDLIDSGTRRMWPLNQIPTSGSARAYFSLMEAFDPSLYCNKYSKAPGSLYMQKAKDLHLSDFEHHCAASYTQGLSGALSANVHTDDRTQSSLRNDTSLYDPYLVVASFLLKFEADLSKACLLDEFWGLRSESNGIDFWADSVRKCRSLPKLCGLLVKLVDSAHPRAFTESWFLPVDSRVTKFSTVSMVRKEPKDRSRRLDASPANVLDECERRHWERSSPEHYVHLSGGMDALVRRLGAQLELCSTGHRKQPRNYADGRRIHASGSEDKTRHAVAPAGVTADSGRNIIEGLAKEDYDTEEVSSTCLPTLRRRTTELDSKAEELKLGATEKLVKKKLEDLVDGSQFEKQMHWPIAGRYFFDPLGYISPDSMRRLGRRGGLVSTAFTTYSDLYEVGQPCNYHVYRKKVLRCASYEELLLHIRFLRLHVDSTAMKQCYSLAARKSKLQESSAILATQRDLRTGLHYHLLSVQRRAHWVSSQDVDLPALVAELSRRRAKRMEEFTEKYRPLDDNHVSQTQAEYFEPKTTVSSPIAYTTPKATANQTSADTLAKQVASIIASYGKDLCKMRDFQQHEPIPPCMLNILREKTLGTIRSLLVQYGIDCIDADIISVLRKRECIVMGDQVAAPGYVPSTITYQGHTSMPASDMTHQVSLPVASNDAAHPYKATGTTMQALHPHAAGSNGSIHIQRAPVAAVMMDDIYDPYPLNPSPNNPQTSYTDHGMALHHNQASTADGLLTSQANSVNGYANAQDRSTATFNAPIHGQFRDAFINATPGVHLQKSATTDFVSHANHTELHPMLLQRGTVRNLSNFGDLGAPSGFQMQGQNQHVSQPSAGNGNSQAPFISGAWPQHWNESAAATLRNAASIYTTISQPPQHVQLTVNLNANVRLGGFQEACYQHPAGSSLLQAYQQQLPINSSDGGRQYDLNGISSSMYGLRDTRNADAFNFQHAPTMGDQQQNMHHIWPSVLPVRNNGDWPSNTLSAFQGNYPQTTIQPTVSLAQQQLRQQPQHQQQLQQQQQQQQQFMSNGTFPQQQQPFWGNIM